jgi:phenylacetate-coenzyme A ligase PaaK-like adenylate-forming protein
MYQRIFSHLLFPAYESLVRRRPTLKYLREYERQQWLSPAEIGALQGAKLRALFEHSAREVPRVRDLLSSIGMGPPDFRSAADLAALPIVTKQDVRANRSAFVAESTVGTNYCKATGGSTGDPFQFEYNLDSEYRRLAVMWRGYRWGGADFGSRSAYIWSWPYAGKRGWRLAKEVAYQRAFGRRFYNIFELSDTKLPEIASDLRKFRPQVVVSYVSAAVALAEWMLAHDFRIEPPRGVITGAEPVHPPQREVIERAFSAPVFNTYGSREVMLMAAECSHHRLHVNADHLVLETVDEDGRAVVGKPGRVVVTDLHNFGMPFIRYANGDVACYDTEACPCGRGLPLLKYVDGREVDIVHLPDGRRLTGLYFVHFFKDFPYIRYFQVEQPQRDELVVRIVPVNGAASESMRGFEPKLKNDLGAITLRTEFVDSIPLTPSGKRRIVISRATPASAHS